VARPAHSDIGSKLFCGDQHEQSVTAAARRTGYGGAPSRLLVRDVARHARARRRHASALAGLILALENGPTTLLGLAVACCAEKWLRRHLWMVDFNSLSPSDQAARIVIDNAMRIDCAQVFLAKQERGPPANQFRTVDGGRAHLPPPAEPSPEGLMPRKPPSFEASARGRRRRRVGRVQRAVRRAFWASRAEVLSTSDLLLWAFPGRAIGTWERSSVRRAAPRFAIQVGSARVARGRPEATWRLR
jgi:hypothetical protein